MLDFQSGYSLCMTTQYPYLKKAKIHFTVFEQKYIFVCRNENVAKKWLNTQVRSFSASEFEKENDSRKSTTRRKRIRLVLYFYSFDSRQEFERKMHTERRY